MNEIDFINKWSPNGFENPYANYCFKSDLDKLNQQIKADVIDEFVKAFCDNENQRCFVTLNQHSHSWDSYAKHIADRLKEKK